jgi:hypothetical protein
MYSWNRNTGPETIPTLILRGGHGLLSFSPRPLLFRLFFIISFLHLLRPLFLPHYNAENTRQLLLPYHKINVQGWCYLMRQAVVEWHGLIRKSSLVFLAIPVRAGSDIMGWL